MTWSVLLDGVESRVGVRLRGPEGGTGCGAPYDLRRTQCAASRLPSPTVVPSHPGSSVRSFLVIIAVLTASMEHDEQCFNARETASVKHRGLGIRPGHCVTKAPPAASTRPMHAGHPVASL